MKANHNIIYISHGGGPMPLLGDPDHQEMLATLKTITKDADKPSAILVISSHWETDVPTVTSGAAPHLIYDYDGFPKEAYEIQYPCAGEPELARFVVDVIKRQGIDATHDEHRGFDHGLFVPLTIMYPLADIPCVQLSLVQTLDPNLHIQIGKALQKLDWSNLLVMGSGFSFHNMRAFFSSDSEEARAKNIKFDNWLRKTISDNLISENIREQQLIHWEAAPSARYCHPREEHLIPLHVCYGMAGKASEKIYPVNIMKKQTSMFSWTIPNLP